MRKNIIAIVGRPNVGKSTIFNRLCHRRSAIVDYEEGVTRDRKYQETEWLGHSFILVDTGGIIPKSSGKINQAIKFQAGIAIEEADFILFIVDTKVGLTDIDMQIGKILSQKREKVFLIANKTDNEKDELEIYDFMKLGFGEPFPMAAANGRNVANFLDELITHIDRVPAETEDDDIKVAIVGKPNVGKSSLINRIFGKEMNIVTDIPGTTRDSIDSSLLYKEKKFTFIDTAGLRKKKKIKYGVEYFSNMRTIESINRSDVVLLIIDADQGITNQDQKIASYAQRNHKDILIVFNKWDLVEKKEQKMRDFKLDIRYQLPFIEFAPILYISALTGLRTNKILDTILQIEEESKKRIPTSKLNKFLEKITSRFPPSHSSGTHVKIYYGTQIQTHPPTFVFFCNNATLLTKHYKRYIHNQLREEFNFAGASIRLYFRSREPQQWQ
ncbi:MAG TPA: ribosome biogenesis GTPase Der [Candidatus Cloacimonas sp.]|nr:GTPase [Candidatus Cloacimonadota bacterium]HCX73818.1 ribosome biogenesis GTPase Der [Candidatus Cloacimonas sp.]